MKKLRLVQVPPSRHDVAQLQSINIDLHKKARELEIESSNGERKIILLQLRVAVCARVALCNVRWMHFNCHIRCINLALQFPNHKLHYVVLMGLMSYARKNVQHIHCLCGLLLPKRCAKTSFVGHGKSIVLPKRQQQPSKAYLSKIKLSIENKVFVDCSTAIRLCTMKKAAKTKKSGNCETDDRKRDFNFLNWLRGEVIS